MSFNDLPGDRLPDDVATKRPVSRAAPEDTYQQGYADGHRAGWHAALQAAAKQSTAQANHADPVAAPAVATLSRETMAPVSAAVASDPPNPLPQALWHPNPAPQIAVSPALGRLIPEKVQARLASLKKHRRDQANINVALYTASMLLIAAAWLFAGFNISGAARFGSLCLLTALFYGAGLVLHAKVKRLQPAGLAFTGTALALVPITGFALNAFVLQVPALSWFITSVIGTAAYLFAALRLRSVVLVWLTLTFMVSSQFAGLSVLGSAIIWYLVVMIAFAAVLNAIDAVLPGRVQQSRLLQPLKQLSPFLVPAVVVSSFVLYSQLTSRGQAFALAVSASYYLVLLVVSPQRERWLNFLGFRLTLTFAVSFAAAWLSTSPTAFIAALAVMTTAQFLIEVFTRSVLGSWLGRLWLSRPESAVNPMEIMFYLTFAFSQLLNGLWFITGLATGSRSSIGILLPVLLALVSTMIAAAVHGTKYAYFPAIPLVFALLFSGTLEVWRVQVVLAIALGYALYQWQRSTGRWRAGYLLAARLVGSAGLALIVMALPPFHDQYYLTLLVIVLLCGAQLLVEAWTIRANTPGLFAEGVAWFWAGIGLIASWAMAFRLVAFGQLVGQEISQLFWERSALSVLAVSVLTASFLLRQQWLARKFRSLECLAPAVFAVLVLWQARDAVPLAVLSIAFLGYTILMLWADPRPLFRGWYLLLARLAAVILLFALADYFAWDVHARWAAFGVLLFAQQGVAMAFKPEWFPAQRITIWAILGLQVLLVPSYWFLSVNSSQRWLIFGLLLAVLVSAVLAQWVKKIDGAAYVAIGALLVMVLAITEVGKLQLDFATGLVFSATGATWLLVGLVLATWGLRLWRGPAQGILRTAWLSASLLYLLSAAVLSVFATIFWNAPFWFFAMVAALIAMVLLSGSWLERVRLLVIPGTFTAILALSIIPAKLVNSITPHPPAAEYWGGLVLLLISIVLLYGLRWVLAALGRLDNVRRWCLLGPLAGLAAVTLGRGIMATETALVAALMMLGVGVIAWFETPARYRQVTFEIGVLLGSMALQRGVYAGHELPRPFWFIVWYVVTAVLLASFRLVRNEAAAARLRMVIASGLLTLAALSTIFTGNGLEQIASLIGFALLLGYGLIRGEKTFVIWAAVGIFVSVLWWLRGYTFILLTLIALMLIGVAVWQMIRNKPKTGA